MIVFLGLGILCAAVVSFLLMPLRDRKAAAAVLCLFPALALGLYLLRGHPDLPSAFSDADARGQRFQIMRLAEKPVARLELTGGRDAGALAVMAELNMRLGDGKGAQRYYAMALQEAERAQDPRAEIYRRKLSALQP